MSEMAKPKKAKVRPATADDFDAVYPLLRELNSTRFSREIWQRLFTNLWERENWSPGYVLDNGERIVGFLGALFYKTELNGEDHTVCNLTAWIVEDAYRSNSIMLLMPFLKMKQTTLTSLTSSREAYKVYKKLGFRDIEQASRILYPVPSLCNSFKVLTSEDEVKPLLRKDELECYQNHQCLDIAQLVITDGSESCFLQITRRLGRGQIQKVSNPEFFQRVIGKVCRKVCRAIDVNSLQVDERFLAGKSVLLSRKKCFPQEKQAKGALSDMLIDGAYSELSVLATP
ncbi:hypothetical protein EOPP23_01155 [Endozoicomonas sp. OPT23]|uniref:hypothetical protein n=1 Tax=Endozoicomonas sp. OPT23 TaxID=2072845 RepID=UPI00129AD3FD|nr:hypothetical protein [Endozoicomonas sp. OPT23]MRI31600.1 hypothetical protein [Endozoicomonas sp. OPT23]